MPKTNIDVQSIVRESKEITKKIKEGLTTSTFTKEEIYPMNIKTATFSLFHSIQINH